MKKLFIVIFAAIFIFSASVALAQTTTYLSDYNFQLDQYRKNFAEYTNFKKDYDDRPTLNNEQKALLSAKQTIISRELAWANFYLVLSESIGKPGVTYPVINKAATDLTGIANYHFGQAGKAGNIATRADLTSFTQEELTVLASHRLPVAQSQVANKLAQLIKFQIDAKTAYDSIVGKLEAVKNEVVVKNGLDQVQTYSAQINGQIEALAKKTTGFDLNESNQGQFYRDSTETLRTVRNLQYRLVSIIIDLDTNYVRH